MITLTYLDKKRRNRGYKVGQKVSLPASEEGALVNLGMATGTEAPNHLLSKKEKEVEPKSKFARK